MTKTVLITGCSSGFGKATALHFARQGWNVVATMRNAGDAGDLSAAPNLLVAPLDVQNSASIDHAVAHAIERFGVLDVLVNNAGFGLHGIFETTPKEKIQEQFAVNLFGVMDVTRAVLPHMRARKSGIIINVSSGAGVFTLPMLSMYCSSKFALEGFSEALSYELLSVGVTVKIVEPGGVTSTRFVNRGMTEAVDPRQGKIADYDPFVGRSMEVFAQLGKARAGGTSEGVAEVIFKAATDGTDRLRYLGTADIAPLLDKRRGASEEEYIAFMRGRFAPTTKA